MPERPNPIDRASHFHTNEPPLHRAARLGDHAAIRELVAAGADVAETDEHGNTILMAAAGALQPPETLELIVSVGVDPNAISDFGLNALHSAVEDTDRDPSEWTDRLRPCVGALKSLGVDLEHRSDAGETPLAHAVTHGLPDAVQALCDLGANPNVTCPVPKSGCGSSCGGCSSHEAPLLFHAVGAYDSDRKLASLLNAGANVLASDAQGHTALTLAVGRLLQGTPDMAARFRAFFKQFEPFARQHEHAGGTRDEVIARVTPAIRAIVEEMLGSLPSPPQWGADNVERMQAASSIIILGAYEIWARRANADPAQSRT
ncbi:MAG: ankyrin repeat domain-containing protein [Phycisphaerales bacterium]